TEARLRMGGETNACPGPVRQAPGAPASSGGAGRLREGTVECGHQLIDLRGVDDERRSDAQAVAPQAALADEDPALARALEDARGRGGVGRLPLADQLHGAHQADAAHVAD